MSSTSTSSERRLCFTMVQFTWLLAEPCRTAHIWARLYQGHLLCVQGKRNWGPVTTSQYCTWASHYCQLKLRWPMGPGVSYLGEVNCTMPSRKASLLRKLVDLADAINQVAYVIVQMFLYLDPLVECNVLLRAVQIPFFLFLTVDKIQGRI
jgi:hypothetical protein